MNSAREHLVDRTRYVFSAPSWCSIASSLVVVSGVGGAIGSAIEVGRPITGLIEGLFVIGLPAVLGALLTTRLGDGSAVDDERSGFLAFVGAVVTVVFVVGATGIHDVLGLGTAGGVFAPAVLAAAGGVFALRLLVLFAVTGPPFRNAVLPASVQPGATVLAVAVAHPGLVTPAIASAVLLITALYTTVALGLVCRDEFPLGRSWGISGFEFVHQFLEYVAGRPTDLESVFGSLGQRVDMPVTVLSIQTSSGEKARVVVTQAHHGPLAGLGGATLPRKLSTGSDGVVFTPHGFSDHDSNPTRQRDVEELCSAANRAAAAVTVEPDASVPTVTHAGDVTVTGQAMGDGALLLSTFAPLATDDVHHRAGEAVAARASEAGIHDPLLVDAHNCRPTGEESTGSEQPVGGHVSPGSARAETLERAVQTAATAVNESEHGPLQVGVATAETPWEPEDGVGTLGVRALATRVAGTTAVYLLIDGNNAVSGLRDSVQEAVKTAAVANSEIAGEHAAVVANGDGGELVDIVELATTDTHEVNRLQADNYVGAAIDPDEVVDQLVSVAQSALADLEPAKAGTATVQTSVSVFGTGTIDNLARAADRFLAFGWKFVVLSAGLVTCVAAILFWVL